MIFEDMGLFVKRQNSQLPAASLASLFDRYEVSYKLVSISSSLPELPRYLGNRWVGGFTRNT